MSIQYFKTIKDLPLKNWRKCNEEGDLRFSRIGFEVDDTEITEEDKGAFEILSDQVIDLFGIPEQVQTIEELRNLYIASMIDVEFNNDRSKLNKMRQYKQRIEEIEERTKGGSLDQNIVHLENWGGFSINEKEISTHKFYTRMNEFVKHCERLEKQQLENSLKT